MFMWIDVSSKGSGIQEWDWDAEEMERQFLEMYIFYHMVLS